MTLWSDFKKGFTEAFREDYDRPLPPRYVPRPVVSGGSGDPMLASHAKYIARGEPRPFDLRARYSIADQVSAHLPGVGNRVFIVIGVNPVRLVVVNAASLSQVRVYMLHDLSEEVAHSEW